mgnify:CR=1 FL=1
MTTFRTEPAGKLSLASIVEQFTPNGALPVRFTAYDGSSAGPADTRLRIDLLTPRGTTYLATVLADSSTAMTPVSPLVSKPGASRRARARNRFDVGFASRTQAWRGMAR